MDEHTAATRQLMADYTAIVAGLHPELLRRSIRNGLQHTANRLRNEARTEFASVTPLGAKGAKALTAKVHRDLSGFRVRVMAHKGAAYYTNRRGKSRPLPNWFEGGTRQRLTRRTSSNRGSIEGANVISGKVEPRYPADVVERYLLTDVEKAARLIFNRLGL